MWKVQIAHAFTALRGDLILIHLVTMFAKIIIVLPKMNSMRRNQFSNALTLAVNNSNHLMEEL